jgi:hypothetical protein
LCRSRSLLESCARQLCTQWWFVSIKPSGDTKEAVQPESRTVARRTFSSHCGVISTPCFCFIAEAGKLSTVHMPSSAAASTGSAAMSEMKKRGRLRVMAPGPVVIVKCGM